MASIHLSSRGWGDYAPLVWTGNLARPDAEIVAECVHLLAVAHDVDTRHQSQDDIRRLLADARKRETECAESRARAAAADKARNDAQAKAGYKRIPGVNVPCPRCRTYCHGDCRS